MALTKLKKRDGRIVEFEKEKITNAIFKAAKSVGGEDIELAKALAEQVVAQLEEKFPKEIPSVEDVQDTVEKVLIENGHAATAKAYILYRKEREELRKAKEMLGVRDELKLPINTIKVLKARYLLKDEEGNVIESTSELFRRVARHLAIADVLYHDLVFDKNREQRIKELPELEGLPKKANDIGLNINNVKMLHKAYQRLNMRRQMKVTFNEMLEILKTKWQEIKAKEDEFYEMMTSFEFMPNSPTIMNAGAPLGQLSACFVLPVGDSLESIFDSLKYTALIHQSGGGTGFSFSHLRPNGDMVKSTKGIASGPLSFMRVFDIATEVIKQGGKRRGANMGIMKIDHPDILNFITSKDSENRILTNFNISVAVTDKFMKTLEKNDEFELLNPRSGVVMKKIFARQLWEMLTYQAWKTGDPGVVFIDEINKHNQTPHIGMVEATNPCVVGDTLISTEFGLMRMKDLAEKYPQDRIKIATDNRVPIQIANKNGTLSIMQTQQSGLSFNSVSNAWRTGVKECYKLTTKCGYEIIATPDHKILTTDEWFELKDCLGKNILIQAGEGNFNNNYELPFEVRKEFTGKNGRKYKLNFPSKWSKELGQVLGLLIADGWIRDKDKNCRIGFTFGSDDIEILNYIKPILNNYYGRQINEVKRERNTIHLSYHSKYFVDFFTQLDVKPWDSSEKRVPETIFLAPKEAVIGFLQGAFTADGTIRDSRKSASDWIAFTSKSIGLVKDMQVLLSNFGIKSVIYDRSRPPREELFEYITKDGKRKTYSSDGILYELGIFGSNIEKFKEKIGFMNSRKTHRLDNIRFKNRREQQFSDVVVSIENVGLKEVYDLTEPITHSMICNSLVVHQCGEQPLLPYESCNLGSINLSKMVKRSNGKVFIDWDRLAKVVRASVDFLDNVIDANSYPIKQIEYMTHASRKIGLGVMGFADMLIKLGICYDSEEALKMGEKVMKFIDETANEKSVELGKARGSFPNFKGSTWDKEGYRNMRNATVTTIAPTGTISIISDCSSGIEPLFAVAFVRKNVLGGEELVDVNRLFERVAKEKGFYSEELMREISKTGSVREIDSIPKDVKALFKTAHDIDYEWHIRMQAAFQKYTDNAVSKTINLRNEAGIKDVENAYLLAYKLKCKGVTIYRDMSKVVQVIHIGEEKRKKIKYVREDEEEREMTESEESCPACKSKLYYAEGCYTCLSCGYSRCG